MSFFGNKRAVLGLVLIFAVIGGIVIYQGPAFHHYVANPLYCQPTQEEIRMHIACGDPFTVLWKDNGIGNLNGYKSFLASYSATDGTGQADPSIKLSPNSTHTSVAVTKTAQDFSTITAKQFIASFTWTISPNNCSTCSIGQSFGVFFTRNGTVSSSPGYNPYSDSNVALLIQVVFAGAGTYSVFEFNQKDPAVSISAQDNGCPSSNTCFLSEPTFTKNPNTEFLNSAFLLNMTGISNSGTCNATSGFGDGCSNLGTNPQSSAAPNPGTSQFVPPFQFQSVSYYVGFFAINNLPVSVFWAFNNGPQGENDYIAFSVAHPQACTASTPCPYQPQPTPTLDDGGFFGPLVRVLVTIGVFILSALATFFNYVFQAFKLAMDTVGNFLGIGPIGTNIINALSNFAVWVTSIFGTAFTQVVNATNFIVGSLTAFAATVGTYWGLLTSFLSDLGSFLGGLWSVLSAFLQYGSIAGKYGLVLWWVMGMSMAYYRIDLFMLWTRLSYMFIWYPFKAADWLFENVIRKIILRFKEIIFQWV